MFKKLFTINYNNKKFLILVDDNHRKTFLEVSNDGKLLYPTLEDFKYLHKIYNEKNPLIFYVTKYKYVEKVLHNSKLTSLIMAIELVAALNIVDMAIASSKDYNTSQTYYSSKYEDAITKRDVLRAINDNENLSEKERKIAYTLLDDMLKLDPDMNLRIYYENMKDLRIKYTPYENLHEETKEFIAGYYSSNGNYIKMVDDASDFIIAHELAHSAHNLCRKVNGQHIVIYENQGAFLVEAMTNKIASQSFEYNYTYYLEGLLLDFFLYNTDNFDYHTYNEIGIKALIDELKEKYIDVDIDYIIDFFQTNADTRINFGEHITLCEEKEALDELFKITISNINKDEPFESFREFMKLTNNDSTVREMYIQRYIDALKKFTNTNDFEVVKSISSLVLVDGSFYISNGEFYYDYDGNKRLIDSAVIIPIDIDSKEDLMEECVKRGEIHSKKFVEDLLLSNVLYDKNIYDYILNMSGNEQELFLNKLFNVIVLSTNDYGELSRLFDTFTNLILRKGLYENYMKSFYDKYNNVVKEKGNFTDIEYETLNDITCIVEYRGHYYLSTMLLSNSTVSTIYGYFDNSTTGFSKFSTIATNPISIECIDENGNKFMLEIDDKIFNYYGFGRNTKEKLIEYFYNVNGNKFSKEHLDGYINSSNIREICRYKNAFTFSDGRTIYDKQLDENTILQIGKDIEGKFVYKLLNGKDELYKSGEIYGNYATMPYMTYLKCCNVTPNNYIDEILSDDVIKVTLRDLMPIIPEVDSKVEWKEVVGYEYKTLDDGTLVKEEEHKKNVPEIVTEFIDPPKLVMDENIGYIRNVYIIVDIDFRVYVYLLDNTRIDITDRLNVDLPNEEPYFSYFEECLNLFDIKPDSNNTYYFTRDEIVEIATNYVNTELSRDFKK